MNLIKDFMNCNFFNYAPIITSQVSRRFVFKLPYPALGKDKGPISPLMLKKIYLRKVHEDCSQTKIRVMKTIRLEVDDLTEIDPDLKVIVLFRDPRAIMTSIKLTPDFWTDENQNENYICSKINQNMAELKKLKSASSRIKFVRYEDFVDQSAKTIEDLYEFLNISYLLPFARQAIKHHIQPEPEEIKWDKLLDGEVFEKPKTRHSLTIY